MIQRATGGSVSAGHSASRYLERLTKALPGTRNWMNRGSQDRWPDGAKLVVSLSLHFESGAQIARDTATAFPLSRAENQYPMVAGTSSYDYGYKEGIPRLLEVFQRRRVRTTCHMVGAAVDHGPELAKEIVERGHEAAAQGQTWAPQYQITPEEERAFCEANIQSIQRATGVRPIGFHGLCRPCPGQTLLILQELGFVYYIDDVSRDEPFVVSVSGKPFSVVPYNPELSDLSLYELRAYSTEQYMGELKNEFEMLYTEAENRRRMMSITLHDRIAGRPARAKVLEEFIIYAQRRPGVVFMRKDEIARFALASSLTPTEEEKLRASADAA